MRSVKSPVSYKPQVTILWTQSPERQRNRKSWGGDWCHSSWFALRGMEKYWRFNHLQSWGTQGHVQICRETHSMPTTPDGRFDSGMVISPSLSLFPFPFPQSCQVVLGLPWSPIKPHNLDRYIYITVRVPTLTENLCSVPSQADVYAWVLSVTSP